MARNGIGGGRIRRRTGFTLVELLVVASIMSLLISILLPSLKGAREQAKRTVCLANLRRLGASAAIYLGENGGRYFPFRLNSADPNGGTTYVNSHGAKEPRWQWFLSTGTGAVIEPSQFVGLPGGQFSDGSVNDRGVVAGTTMTNDYFLCPSLKGSFEHDIRNGAYGFNYQFLGNSRTTGPGGGKRFVHFPVSETQVRAPAATVVFADSRGADPKHGKHSYTLDPPRLATENGADQFGPKAPNDGPIAHSPAEARHHRTASVAWADGHAEPMTLTDLGYELDNAGVVAPDLGAGAVALNRLWTGLNRDPLRLGR